MENASRSASTTVAGQAVHALNNTAIQFATHPPVISASSLLIAAAFGFVPGLIFGLKKG